MDMVRFYPKKITVREMKLSPDVLETEVGKIGPTESVLVASIYGRVKGSKPESGDLGAYTRFSGEFEAVNHIESTCFRSRTLIVPAVAEPILQEHLDCKSEEFAINLVISPNASTKGGAKYRWEAFPLSKATSEADALTQIGMRLGAVPQAAIEEKPSKSKKS